MNKEKFLAICKPYKNIINTEEINGVLSQIIKQKKLDNKEHIKKLKNGYCQMFVNIF